MYSRNSAKNEHWIKPSTSHTSVTLSMGRCSLKCAVIIVLVSVGSQTFWFLYLSRSSLTLVGVDVFKSTKWPYRREAHDPLTPHRICGGSNRFNGDSERARAIWIWIPERSSFTKGHWSWTLEVRWFLQSVNVSRHLCRCCNSEKWHRWEQVRRSCLVDATLPHVEYLQSDHFDESVKSECVFADVV